MKLKQEYEKYQELYNKGFRFDPEESLFYTDKPKTFKKPEGYEQWSVESFDPKEYLTSRLNELGITPEENQIDLVDEKGKKTKSRESFQVFTSNKFGDIEILQYTLHRKALTFLKSGKENDNHETYRAQVRLNPISTIVTSGKYDFSEAKNTPFWHKSLIDAFEREIEVPTLVITEGQFKAFKASMDGIPTVGLTSISHFKEKETGKIHSEIIEFIRKCQVKRVVILWDADCRDISTKDLEKKADVSKRPYLFYKFATNIRKMIQEYFPGKKGLEFYFATINDIDVVPSPKGLDDILIHLKNAVYVKDDINNIGERPGKYIYAENITQEHGVKKLYAFFKLDSVREFYTFHKEKIKNNNFVFLNSTYRLENSVPVVEISSDLKNFIRVGDGYYELIQKPFQSPSGAITYEEELTPRLKTTVTDDYGKDSFKHIPKYKAFVNIAEHVEYKKVVGNCWNLYYELDHKPVPGSWEHIDKLIRHLFKDQYEIALDYLTILYRFPMHHLPVLFLLSKKQKTGKSTFIYLTKLLFKNNAIGIASQEFLEDFNDHWITKLLVTCEETIFHKKDAYEKIKSLSTAAYVNRKEKQKSGVQVSNSLHFIFASNHENDAIKIGDDDTRLWIVKADEIKEKIIDFDDRIESEINEFIYFIQNREISHRKESRVWFMESLLRTEAFHNIVKHSEPGIIKDIRESLVDSFTKFKVDKIEMQAKDLIAHFRIRGELNYINKAINEFLKPNRITNIHGEEYVRNYKFPIDDPSDPTKPIFMKGKGRPFEFKAKDFLNDVQLRQLKEATGEVAQGDLQF